MNARPPIGLCWGTVRDMDAIAMARLAGRHGYDAVALIPAQLAGLDLAEVRRVLDGEGIARVMLDGVLGMLPRLPDWVRALGVPEDRYFAIAEALGVTTFNVPHYRGDPATPRQELVDALGPVAERAQRAGIRMALEFLPGTGIPDPAAALQLAQAIGNNTVGVMVDTWHLARAGGTLADIEALPAGSITGFQINDRTAGPPPPGDIFDDEMFERLIPGEGALPLLETLRMVLARAPDVAVDVEIFSQAVREGDAAASDDFASRALAAIRHLISQC